ncbi:hypothetical protein B0A55_09168 [Friedmanniomyces simplex]|uniref:BHLH domain-containing protein n=1 Tax=Friedmanniomyces simplex TaxID=329884 RepID=A0A4U0WV96_9PEZI|nr:hypothetical protein B0A55_09168 [Friedmanniomyces simplex]
MPDDADHEWRHQPFGQMPTLASQWPDQPGSRMGGMQDVDLSVFQHDTHQYPGSYGTAAQLIPPGFGYYGEVTLPSCSDVEMHTPSTAGFPPGVTEGYFPRDSVGYLKPPTSHGLGSVTTQSPKSAQSDISPRQKTRYPDTATPSIQRPAIGRSATAPEPRCPPALKRSGTSEDEDEEYVPVEGSKAGRGRKRQRIPHTAVERRYRENLNAHLDKLRQSVPAFASRALASKTTGGVCQEGVKPSKCEVLNGAIEHIGALDKENRVLRDEVKMLRARIEEMERWHRNSSRGGGFGT